MSVIPFERRRRRSSNTFEAITLQLEYILNEAQLNNFVLADGSGLLIAHAGRADDAHVLAAYAPVVAECEEKHQFYEVVDQVREHVPEVNSSNLSVRSFEVDGYLMHLVLVGERRRVNHSNIYRATTGVQRILRENEVAA
jgi:hypothetical protein